MNAYINSSAAIKVTSKPKFEILDGYRSTIDTAAPVFNKPVVEIACNHNKVSLQTYLQVEKFVGAIVSILAIATLCYSLVGFLQSSYLRHATLDSMMSVETRVQPGESLWSIAEDNPIEGFTTQEVAQMILQENSLESSMLQPGQTLLVPHTFA